MALDPKRLDTLKVRAYALHLKHRSDAPGINRGVIWARWFGRIGRRCAVCAETHNVMHVDPFAKRDTRFDFGGDRYLCEAHAPDYDKYHREQGAAEAKDMIEHDAPDSVRAAYRAWSHMLEAGHLDGSQKQRAIGACEVWKKAGVQS